VTPLIDTHRFSLLIHIVGGEKIGIAAAKQIPRMQDRREGEGGGGEGLMAEGERVGEEA
jgi:hypothetical protein